MIAATNMTCSTNFIMQTERGLAWSAVFIMTASGILAYFIVLLQNTLVVT